MRQLILYAVVVAALGISAAVAAEEPRPPTARIVERPPFVRLPIFFEYGSSNLTTESQALLEKVAASLSSPELAGFRFLIEGHTDSTGDAEDNLELSRERAATVKDYLVSLGVHEERLTSAGLGESNPVAPNDSAEGRLRNQRIEIINLGAFPKVEEPEATVEEPAHSKEQTQ
jgi:outer membrane protein OmpA-like peptidoglycan-associated protein